MAVLPLAAPDNHDCHTRLAALGTKLEYLYEALRAGEEAHRTATLNHPANTAGTRAYEEHVRILREMHIRHEGWKRLRHDYLELVCSPDGAVAIGVMPGDTATGDPLLLPRNARRRGGSTARAAEENAFQQMELFSGPRPRNEIVLSKDEAQRLQVWFLVWYRHQVSDKVFFPCELSLPGDVTDGYVTRWEQRIPLPAFQMDGIERPDDDGDGEINIAIDFR
ncbi:hypothetical protein ACF06W_19050 [Streptomyces albus]|uniref:hypothetical protein n=1 Tax=Streptomyces albus TaxID=1888 RepID=UPI0036FFED1E